MARLLPLLVLPFLAASCGAAGSHRVPFEQDFPATGLAHAEFSIAEKQLYAVSVHYAYTSAPGDRERVWKLTGGTDQDPPYRIQARIAGSGEAPRTIGMHRPRLTTWSGRQLSAEVARVELTPGRYTIDLQLVEGRLPAGVPVTYSVRRAYIGK